MTTEAALDYALQIIKSYELDCRHLTDYLKDNDAEGFCQGVIYKEARQDIEQLRHAAVVDES